VIGVIEGMEAVEFGIEDADLEIEDEEFAGDVSGEMVDPIDVVAGEGFGGELVFVEGAIIELDKEDEDVAEELDNEVIDELNAEDVRELVEESEEEMYEESTEDEVGFVVLADELVVYEAHTVCSRGHVS
jgi:hypothetical protein